MRGLLQFVTQAFVFGVLTSGLLCVQTRGEVVLNEISYHPVTDSSAEEFIELYNTGPGTVDLTGWRFTRGITFEFPEGTVLREDEYLVVARDPEALRAVYPGIKNVYGPFTGLLRNGGETLTLEDAAGTVADTVTYDDALPWPTAPDGEGPTLELRNPRLDNSRPENWAASDVAHDPSRGWQTYSRVFAVGVEGTFYFYMTDLDETGWIGDSLSVHVLFDDFRIEDLGTPGSDLITDGGFEAGDADDWVVEGTLHARFASREDAYSGDYCLHYWALESGGVDRGRVVRYTKTPLNGFRTYRLSFKYRVIHGEALFFAGVGETNIPGSVHLKPRTDWGTPSAPNSSFSSTDFPVLESLDDVGDRMPFMQPEEVVATFNDGADLGTVTLWYGSQQIGFDGPTAFPKEMEWHAVVMTADPPPNRSVYRAEIPAQTANTIVRYYLEWTNGSGVENRYPHFWSRPRNLAAFIPGEVPDFGVPQFFLHIDPEYPAFYKAMMFSGEVAPGIYGILRQNRPTFPATLVDLDEGKVYEDIEWKPRGWDTLDDALQEGFRTGQSFEFHPGFRYKGRKREIDLHNNYSRRGQAGIGTRLAHEVYRRAGVPVSRTRYVWVTRNGTPLGLMTDLESPDNEFLQRWGRDGEGSLYKARWYLKGEGFSMEGLLRANEQDFRDLDDYERCYLKKNRRNSNHSDLIRMCKDLNRPRLVGRVFFMDINGSDIASQKDFFETQIDVDNLLTKYGVDHVLANHDRGQQNHYLYQDVSRDGKWETYPWDLNISWDPGTQDLWNTLGQFTADGNLVRDPDFAFDWWFYEAEPMFTRLVAVPEFRERYVRKTHDLLVKAFSERQLFQILDGYADEGRTAFAKDLEVWGFDLDQEIVDYCNQSGISTGDPMECAVAWFKDHLKKVRQAAFWRARTEDNDNFNIPPVLSDGRTVPVVPSPGDPIEFRVNAISAGAGNLDEGIRQVVLRYHVNDTEFRTRVMTKVTATAYDGDYRYRIDPLPDGTVLSYWFEVQDDADQTARLPETGTYQTEIVANPESTKPFVVINEIMYNSDLDGNEWVEIKNSATRYVDVSRWMIGDDNPDHRFRFPVDVVLAPGERLVVAANELVVREQYGIDNVIGDIEFNFGNGGDTVRLFDAAGILVDTVAYDDAAPWPTSPDGNGPSLELMDAALDNSLPASWTPSRALRGTPGQPNGTGGEASLFEAALGWYATGGEKLGPAELLGMLNSLRSP